MTTIATYWNWYKSQNYSLRILVDLTISMAVTSYVVTTTGMSPTMFSTVVSVTTINIWNAVNSNIASERKHKKQAL